MRQKLFSFDAGPSQMVPTRVCWGLGAGQLEPQGRSDSQLRLIWDRHPSAGLVPVEGSELGAGPHSLALCHSDVNYEAQWYFPFVSHQVPSAKSTGHFGSWSGWLRRELRCLIC